MPLQIPATSFVMFAHLMGMGAPGETEAWVLSDREAGSSVTVISATRQIESAQACLDLARAEGARMALTEAREASGGPVTLLQFAQGVSFSCAQIAPAAGVMAINGPEALLRAQGYHFPEHR